MAIAYWPGVDCQSAYAPLDVIGFNDYFGWFDAGGGSTDDPDELSPYLDFLHTCYPSKSLMITEFGFEGNRSGPVEERGTYQFQAAAAAFHLGVFASKPYISAAMWFALQDFAGPPGLDGRQPVPATPRSCRRARSTATATRASRCSARSSRSTLAHPADRAGGHGPEAPGQGGPVSAPPAAPRTGSATGCRSPGTRRPR